MGSMKSGVGDDPFAEDDSSDESQEDVDSVAEQPEESQETSTEPTAELETEASSNSQPSESVSTEQSTQEASKTATEAAAGQATGSTIETLDVVDAVPHENQRIPFIMSRQSVKGSRDGTILQIALNRETQNYLEEAVREIQREFEDDVKKMDISEAVLLAGLMNLGDVDSVLRTWGYDFQSD